MLPYIRSEPWSFSGVAQVVQSEHYFPPLDLVMLLDHSLPCCWRSKKELVDQSKWPQLEAAGFFFKMLGLMGHH